MWSQQGVRGQAAQQGNKAASLSPADSRLAALSLQQRRLSYYISSECKGGSQPHRIRLFSLIHSCEVFAFFFKIVSWHTQNHTSAYSGILTRRYKHFQFAFKWHVLGYKEESQMWQLVILRIFLFFIYSCISRLGEIYINWNVSYKITNKLSELTSKLHKVQPENALPAPAFPRVTIVGAFCFPQSINYQQHGTKVWLSFFI